MNRLSAFRHIWILAEGLELTYPGGVETIDSEMQDRLSGLAHAAWNTYCGQFPYESPYSPWGHHWPLDELSDDPKLPRPRNPPLVKMASTLRAIRDRPRGLFVPARSTHEVIRYLSVDVLLSIDDFIHARTSRTKSRRSPDHLLMDAHDAMHEISCLSMELLDSQVG